MKQRKIDDFMAAGLGRVGAQHAVDKWLHGRAPSKTRRHVYLWYEKKPSTCVPARCWCAAAPHAASLPLR
jgi:hypothetical protein